jgi:hypothetical protein
MGSLCSCIDGQPTIGSRLVCQPDKQGWKISAGRSAVAEVYPALWNRTFAREQRTPDQHDAYSVAAWMRRADLDGNLAAVFFPSLPPEEADKAQIEGWILGVPGSTPSDSA